MKRNSLVCLFLCLNLSLRLFAQEFTFKKYQVENGLSHNTVSCVLQDHYGFIWFGTSDGLNRFDGQKFTIYRTQSNKKKSLGNNFIQALCEDNRSNIWLGTNKGIYLFHPSSNDFSYFDKKTDDGVLISSDVKRIIKTQSGTIWIATLGQGVFIYDPKTDHLSQNSQYSSFVWDIGEDKEGNIYLSSMQEGLIEFDAQANYIRSYTSFLNKDNIGNSRINCIQGANNDLWFSVGVNNLSCIDIDTQKLKSYIFDKFNLGTIRSIINFSDDKLLIGCDNGIYRFTISSEELVRIDDPLSSNGLSDQSICAMLKDKEGGTWIATSLGGVNYLPKYKNFFKSYFPSHTSGSISGKVISQFCEDKTGNIWIGTQAGLNILDTKTKKIATYKISSSDKSYDIRSLLIDDDRLWLGTFSEGLKIIDLKTKKVESFKHLSNDANTIRSNDVLSLYKDKNNNIYVGTSWGLNKYNATKNDFEPVNDVGGMVSIFDILEDSCGFLWFASYNSGVFRYNPQRRVWKHYVHHLGDQSSIVSNSVITIFEDSKGTMWFGTEGGGLCSFDAKTEKFTDFDPQNTLLPNKVIYSMEEDRSGNFWISSNAGLVRVNPVTKKNTLLFTKEDGLQGNQFNFRSSIKSTTGEFYFGGINGFNSFDPNDFKENSFVPPVYITNLKLFNKDEGVNNALHLTQPIYMTKELTLGHAQNTISFDFTALSYEEPKKNQYSYMLEGLDKDWVFTNNLNSASYTNLPPGDYTFRVRASNNNRKWNTVGASIKIHILPPWWLSTYAYIIYSFLLFSIIYLVSRYLTKQTNQKIRNQINDYEIKKEKELYETKINFFINLAHEIRTPLTLIKLPLENIFDSSDKAVVEKQDLRVIDKNVNYLLNLVNQLLDFRKIETKEPQLRLNDCDINKFLTDIHNQFSQFAELKGIELELMLPSAQEIVSVDEEKINKIVHNLLSNALKYAKTKIVLKLKFVDQRMEICVSDDGLGISDTEKDKIFEAFYQVDEPNNTGTGIGLAFSKLLAESHNGNLTFDADVSGGSSFVLSIPIGEHIQVEHLSEAPLAEDGDKVIEENFEDSLILIVEDNLDLLNLLASSLGKYFRIAKACNGKEALDMLEIKSVDLVVSDVTMPKMDGFELCERMKSEMNFCHIPIVLLTAKTTLDAKIKGLEYGADSYIEKPFSLNHLRSQIVNLLKSRALFRKLFASLPMDENVSNLIDISPKDQEFINKLQTEIETHLSNIDFMIDDLSDIMCMSRSNFYRKIKAISGMSPNTYLKTIRLNKAAELLLKQDLPISEIYDQVGFNSASYFAKCFKTQFGVLPKDYSKK